MISPPAAMPILVRTAACNWCRLFPRPKSYSVHTSKFIGSKPSNGLASTSTTNILEDDNKAGMYMTHEVMPWLKSQVLELERLRLGMAEFNKEVKGLKQVMNLNLHGGHQDDHSIVSQSRVKEENLTTSKDGEESRELLSNFEDVKSRVFDIECKFSEAAEEIEKLRAYTHEQIGEIEGEVKNHESRLAPIEVELNNLKVENEIAKWSKSRNPHGVFDSRGGFSLDVEEIEKLRAYTDEQIGEIYGEVQNHESKLVPMEDELQILKAENEVAKSRFFKMESMLRGAMEEMEKLRLASAHQINQIESEVMSHKSQLDPIKDEMKTLNEEYEKANSSFWKLVDDTEELGRSLYRVCEASIGKMNTNSSNIDAHDQLSNIEDGVMYRESDLVSLEDEVQVLKEENQESESRFIELESKFSYAMEEMGKLRSSTQEVINTGCKVKNSFWKLEDDMHAKFNDAYDQINKIKVEVMNLKSKMAPIEDEAQVLKEGNEEAKSELLELESKVSNAMEEMDQLRSYIRGEIINMQCKLMDDHKSNLDPIKEEVQVLKAEKEEVEKRLKTLEMMFEMAVKGMDVCLRCGMLLRRLLLLSAAVGLYCYYYV